MKKQPFILIAIASLLLNVGVAFAQLPALQEQPGVPTPTGRGKPVAEGITLFERVSRSELNRLSIGNGRIAKMHFKTEELEATKDDALGQVFFTPKVDKTISVFVTTASGMTFTLVLQPVPNMPAVNVALMEQRPQDAAAANGRVVAQQPAPLQQMSYEQAISTLVFGAATSQQIPGVSEERVGQQMALWQGTSFVHVRNLRTSGIRLEEYRLMNIGNTVIRLVEQELYKPGVMAVAVEQHVLEPGEGTPVFVIVGDKQ
jgi:conjugal transfer pilus assembly protein TraK